MTLALLLMLAYFPIARNLHNQETYEFIFPYKEQSVYFLLIMCLSDLLQDGFCSYTIRKITGSSFNHFLTDPFRKDLRCVMWITIGHSYVFGCFLFACQWFWYN